MKLLYLPVLVIAFLIAYIKMDQIVYPILIIPNNIIKTAKKYLYKSKTNAITDSYRREIESLKSELVIVNSKLDFIEKTKELIDFSHRYRQKKMLAQVIFKHIDNMNNFYLLDHGYLDGIEADMVIIYKNCLVGKIIEVHKYWSKAVLITDKSCKISALCSKTKTQGIHEGTNLVDSTKLQFVDHLKKITKGDLVISSGEGLIFPKGFGLGTIDKYELDGLTYNITLKPLINFKDLEYCYIILK